MQLELRRPNRKHRAYKWYKLKVGKRKKGLARARRHH